MNARMVYYSIHVYGTASVCSYTIVSTDVSNS